MKSNLFGMDLLALQELLSNMGRPSYHASQLYVWLYKKRVRTFSEMTDLPKALRNEIEGSYVLKWPKVANRETSKDGTVKYLFLLGDGAAIESVYIPEAKRRTICISTQAGCPLRCAFCLTGIGGYRRNLKPWEILGQVAALMRDAPAQVLPWNVVVMGMGEPLLNYEATVTSLRILMDPDGFAVAAKKLTLSTVGILPALERLMKEGVRPNLAISLHAPNSTLRGELMPIEEKYTLSDVIATASRYPVPRGGRVTYEYVLLRGVNDRPVHARELVRLLKGKPAKVNLIPLNPARQIPFEAPTPEAVDSFRRILAESHIAVSVRRPRGQDILAACGQLHLRDKSPTLPQASAL